MVTLSTNQPGHKKALLGPAWRTPPRHLPDWTSGASVPSTGPRGLLSLQLSTTQAPEIPADTELKEVAFPCLSRLNYSPELRQDLAEAAPSCLLPREQVPGAPAGLSEHAVKLAQLLFSLSLGACQPPYSPVPSRQDRPQLTYLVGEVGHAEGQAGLRRPRVGRCCRPRWRNSSALSLLGGKHSATRIGCSLGKAVSTPLAVDDRCGPRQWAVLLSSGCHMGDSGLCFREPEWCPASGARA